MHFCVLKYNAFNNYILEATVNYLEMSDEKLIIERDLLLKRYNEYKKIIKNYNRLGGAEKLLII